MSSKSRLSEIRKYLSRNLKKCKAIYWLGIYLGRKFMARLPHPPRYLIIPADIDNVAGSRGDQAALAVIVSQIQNTAKTGIIEVAARNSLVAHRDLPAGAKAVSYGAISTKSWKRTAILAGYDALFVQGADVMDGFYNEDFAIQLWEVASEAHSQLDTCSILGISINSKLSRRVRQIISSAPEGLKVGVRDPISLERLRAVRPGFGKAVADVAFLLPECPFLDCTPSVHHSLAWCQARRNAGSIVVGVNLHPMLFGGDNNGDLGQLVATFAAAMRAMMAEQNISFLLLPHDFREPIADNVALEWLMRLLQPDFSENVRWHSEDSHAAEIKTLASGLDALVTGRMHLGIAALGQSVPVAALPYQDKFEGLFQLFELPSSLMLEPRQACHVENVLRLFKTLIDERQSLAVTIGNALPKIITSAKDNFRL